MPPIVISLDGNIGAGKSTLLARIHSAVPEWHVVNEPVDTWTSLKNDDGRNLLELFYEDKKRWSYTFQNCAILTRLKSLKHALKTATSDVIITERSVLTDRYVFAEMLRDSGDINALEWTLYESWFNIFSNEIPIHAIIHLTTSAETSEKRIHIRNRHGEEGIPIEYLKSLDVQHQKWIKGTDLPVLEISTEEGVDVDATIERIKVFIEELKSKK
jgi:deoxyadenosine/deoxycytidine kinase